jgi:hypothetical protein
MATVYSISISEEIIARATQRDSRHCMIAEAIKEANPAWEAITVDLATVRWTSPRTRKRYICLTPNDARNALVAFDQGWEIQPFRISLRPIQITPVELRERDTEGNVVRRQNRGRAEIQIESSGQHTIIGGKPLPMGHLAGTVQSSEQVAREAQRRTPPKPAANDNVRLSSGKWRQYGLQQLAK